MECAGERTSWHRPWSRRRRPRRRPERQPPPPRSRAASPLAPAERAPHQRNQGETTNNRECTREELDHDVTRPASARFARTLAAAAAAIPDRVLLARAPSPRAGNNLRLATLALTPIIAPCNGVRGSIRRIGGSRWRGVAVAHEAQCVIGDGLGAFREAAVWEGSLAKTGHALSCALTGIRHSLAEGTRSDGWRCWQLWSQWRT